jgi:hypothetical protein
MLVRKSADDNLRGRFARSRIRASTCARFFGTTIGAAILGCGLGFAGHGPVRNADYWQHLAQPEKVTYIEGYADAMRLSDQKFEDLVAAAELLHWNNARRILRQARRDMMRAEITPAELIEDVNKVYSEPAYHNLELVQAMRLAIMKSVPSVSNSAISRAK